MKTFFKWLNTNKERYTSTFYGPFAIIYKPLTDNYGSQPFLRIHTEDGWMEVALTKVNND